MAITYSPIYPEPGDSVEFLITGTSADLPVVYELTSVPAQSSVVTGLLLIDLSGDATAPTSPVEALELGYEASAFVPDEPGEYGITAWIYSTASAMPSYVGDPSSDDRYVYSTTESVTLKVMSSVDLPIITERGDGATLSLAVDDQTIRTAELVDPTTEAARTALAMAGPVAALAALVGQTIATVGTDLQTGVNDLRAKYEAHRVKVAGCHDSVDATNYTGTTACTSQAGAILLLNKLREVVLAHMRNSTSGTSWHDDDDLCDVPLCGPATDLASATVLSADLRERAYEDHRQRDAANPPDCHGAHDAVNELAAPSLLDELIVSYLDAIASIIPAAPAGEHAGAIAAWHRYGFIRRT